MTLRAQDLAWLRGLRPYKDARLVRECSYPTTQNIVCTINYGTPITLERLSSMVPLSLLKPRFSAGTVRFMNTTIQTFGAGNCTSLGGSSVYEILWSAHNLRFMLRRAGFDAGQGRPMFCNRVCSGSVGHGIDIKNFEKHDSIGTISQDGAFPGILYFLKSPRTGTLMMFLIFDTGKFIVMGLTKNCDEEAQEAFDLILPTLRRNRSKTRAQSTSITQRLGNLTKSLSNNFERIQSMSQNDEELVRNFNELAKLELATKSTRTKRKRKAPDGGGDSDGEM